MPDDTEAVDPDAPVTELSGIGPSTAEDLDTEGVETVGDLVDRYLQAGDRFDDTNSAQAREPFSNKRVREAARSAAYDRFVQEDASVRDPLLDVEVTPENRQAVETLATKRLSDFSSIDTEEAKRKGGPRRLTADSRIVELARSTTEGQFFNVDTKMDPTDREVPDPTPALGFAADTAANVLETDLSSGELQDLNRLNMGVRAAARTGGGATEERRTVGVDDALRAAAYQRSQRSPRARRVDRQRQAPKTTDYEEWRADPAHKDFVGVDTTSPLSDYFGEVRVSRSNGIGSRTKKNRDLRTVERAVDVFESTTPEVQSRVLDLPDGDGDALEAVSGQIGDALGLGNGGGR